MLPDLSNLVAITKLNTKATKIKKKISSITCLVITDAVNTKVTEAENKIPDFSGLVKKQILTQNLRIKQFQIKQMTLKKKVN